MLAYSMVLQCDILRIKFISRFYVQITLGLKHPLSVDMIFPFTSTLKILVNGLEVVSGVSILFLFSFLNT